MRVNFEENHHDAMVRELANRGFFLRVIAEKTGLSIGQVSYRTRKGGCSPLSYRRGESDEGKAALRLCASMLSEVSTLIRASRRMRAESRKLIGRRRRGT